MSFVLQPHGQPTSLLDNYAIHTVHPYWMRQNCSYHFVQKRGYTAQPKRLIARVPFYAP